MKVSVSINGESYEREVAPHRRLLDFLRQDLGLTGTKEGCSEGECGACTVLVDGRPACACLIAVGQVHGREVGTVEGLADGDTLHAVQDALIRYGGTQCGICTPGIAVCASHVMATEPDASRDRVRELLAGNICRCTGYHLIVDAVIDASRRMDQAKGDGADSRGEAEGGSAYESEVDA